MGWAPSPGRRLGYNPQPDSSTMTDPDWVLINFHCNHKLQMQWGRIIGPMQGLQDVGAAQEGTVSILCRAHRTKPLGEQNSCNLLASALRDITQGNAKTAAWGALLQLQNYRICYLFPTEERTALSGEELVVAMDPSKRRHFSDSPCSAVCRKAG